MPEPHATPSEVAAEDQALASARHAADCVVRFHQVLTEADLDAELVANLTDTWLTWFLDEE
jgi:hypothetical protein